MTTVLPPLEPPVSRSRLRVAMGTFVAIEAEGRHDSLALQGIEAAFDAILTVQQLMHPLRGTDLAAIAGCPAGVPLKVHRWTWEVLDLCQRLHHASLGIFDPCLVERPGRMADLQLLPGDALIAHAPMRIDLGGIAKGYAVDRAVDALRAAGCGGGLVNAGGDLAVFGRHGRSIVCSAADADGIVIQLHDAALASSDACCSGSLQARRRPAEHRGYYDGRGRHAIVSGNATVMAARAAVADGLTKCLLAAQRELRAALLETFDAKQVLC
jgi:FAD:protein FMN transferase